jgi:hypothetical protein
MVIAELGERERNQWPSPMSMTASASRSHSSPAQPGAGERLHDEPGAGVAGGATATHELGVAVVEENLAVRNGAGCSAR